MGTSGARRHPVRVGALTAGLPPIPSLARAPVRLFLTSATLLFVELLLIRWIPANVTYIGFFSNFLLMASFLGIGLGILLGRRFARVTISPFPLLLLGTVALVYAAQLNVQVRSPDEIFFGLRESGAADINFVVLPLMVVLVMGIMSALALPLGPLLRAMPPLNAYAVDIAGSMCGIAAFTALSAAGTSPFVWFSVVAALLLLLAASTGITRFSTLGGAAMLLVLLISAGASRGDVWSSYYRVTAYQEFGRTAINVNGIPHQTLWASDDRQKEPFYEQVYRWFPDRGFSRVLIIGAGSGSDTAVALDHGAAHIDAVEIDPTIQRIGVERHPDRPYADHRVTRINNDGRAFLRNSDERYDLVVFALPDSLTLVSSTANVRLESFLFTEGAFASVREHLADGGVFVLYNYYREPWLVAKLANMLEDEFGHRPLLRLYGNGVSATLAAGPAVAALHGADPPGDRVDRVPDVGSRPRPATDDWPFLYLRQPFIAGYYLAALGFILVGAVLAVAAAARVTTTPVRRFSPHFFVLGTAFLLLETRSLVSFSLLFGTTWIVNALAFFAILASVLLAIFVNARFAVSRPQLLYAGLLASLLLAFIVPPESLLIDPPLLRYALAAGLAFAPVFFANLVFSYSFRDTRTADMAFASNLLGAMLGGALEYLALLAGYRFLLVVVAGLYALAYLFATSWRRLADVNLAREQAAIESHVVAEPAR
ncbi:MAG: spermidine synthase [Chloroflexota bacterium]|nr:spermidine synthase [Chloroflexota bacterium]